MKYAITCAAQRQTLKAVLLSYIKHCISPRKCRWTESRGTALQQADRSLHRSVLQLPLALWRVSAHPALALSALAALVHQGYPCYKQPRPFLTAAVAVAAAVVTAVARARAVAADVEVVSEGKQR
jgi:hypothetical protein